MFEKKKEIRQTLRSFCSDYKKVLPEGGDKVCMHSSLKV